MNPIIRQLGKRDYIPVWQEMQRFTQQRDETTDDELWLVEHPPVYTLGLNGKREHLLRDNKIDIVAVDRGGQVTYHGPGQSVVYLLCDLARLKLGVREFVHGIEQSIIDLLAEYDIPSSRREGAPGVYVNDAKIAALGLRIKKNRSYHGLSLNLDMDLSPFADINPCGYPDLTVTQLKDHNVAEDMARINERLIAHLLRNLGYNANLEQRQASHD